MRVLVAFTAVLAISSASKVNTKRGLNHEHQGTYLQGAHLSAADISAEAAPAFDNRVSFSQGPSHSDMGGVADFAFKAIARHGSLTQSHGGGVSNTDNQADYTQQNEAEHRGPFQEYGQPPPLPSSESSAPSTSQESFNYQPNPLVPAEGSTSNAWASQGPSVVEGTAIGQPYLISIHREIVRRYGVPVAKPYPVKVHKDIEVPIERQIPVKIDRPYAVRINVPQPYAVDRPYPVPVDRPYSVPVPQPVAVPVPHPVAVHVPVPTPVHVRVPIPHPVIVHAPQQVPAPVPVAAPIPVAATAPAGVPVPVNFPAPAALPAPAAESDPETIPASAVLPAPTADAAPVATVEDLRSAQVPSSPSSSLREPSSLVFSTLALNGLPAFALSQATVTRGTPQDPAAIFNQNAAFQKLFQASHPLQFNAATPSGASARLTFHELSSTSYGPQPPQQFPPPASTDSSERWPSETPRKRSVYKH